MNQNTLLEREAPSGVSPDAASISRSAPSLDALAAGRRKDAFHRGLRMRRETFITFLSLAITVFATAMTAIEMTRILAEGRSTLGARATVEIVLFAGVFLFLIYGNLAYQLARLGYLRRLRRHRPVDRRELLGSWGPEREAPRVTVLVPSYKEGLRVVRQSLLSSALQEYPWRRVVLLIDDPPSPGDPDDALALAAVRQLPKAIQDMLDGPAARFARAESNFLARVEGRRIRVAEEHANLALLHEEVTGLFERWGSEIPVEDHSDQFLVEMAFLERAESHRNEAAAHRGRATAFVPASQQTLERLRREYHRLAWLFRAEVTSFERKQVVNLSWAPNKAMNLNSYLGLIGKSFREVPRGEKREFVPASAAEATFVVPDSKYVVTLDADSILAPDYVLRLVEVMERPGNERLAVIQTPYSAFPNPPGLLERIAGATTDMQYIVHQGFASVRATYWVGANALLRRAALEDIVAEESERGFTVARYIQDRTVIEDTESSVDLIARGWWLENYPERLSYSATPPDFGSLVIQRARWANGGLIILPKLLGYLVRRLHRPAVWREGFMRVHYLASIAGTNLGLLLILAYPMEKELRLAWLPLTAAPYYFLYGRDMVQAGYRLADLFRVYALNLLLLPVNLGGVLKSIEQMITGAKIPFRRTPKVSGRTPVDAMFVAAVYVLLGHCLFGALWDIALGRWLHAAFSMGNAAVLYYAVGVFLGFRESVEDLRTGWAARLPIWLRTPLGRRV